MKRRMLVLSFTLAVLTSSIAFAQSPLQIQEDWRSQVPVEQLIIKYKDSNLATAASAGAESQMRRISAAVGVELLYFRVMSGDGHVVKLPAKMTVEQAEAIAEKLTRLPEVEYAEPDYIMFPMSTPEASPQSTPSDPLYNSQWHYFSPSSGSYGVDAPAAWNISTGSNKVYVAVLDTGILDHADLNGRWIGGYDMISNVFIANDGNGRDSNPRDPGDWITANECGVPHPAENSSWHGSHVAGTIAAATNNGRGVAGLNWVSKVVPVRVLGKCGGMLSDIADGIRWAAGLPVSGVSTNPYPAKVINMSLGGSGSCGSTYQSAIDAAYSAGSAIIVAAGNNNANAANYRPANCNNVVTVAATNRSGSRAYYSNYGSIVKVSGPGGAQSYANDPNGVLSTLNSGTKGPVADTYKYYQGTSMAAPHVAGIASLMYSVKPDLKPAEVLSALKKTVTPFPSGSSCSTSICGSGIVHAGRAVQAVSSPVKKLPFLSILLAGGEAPPPATCPAIPNGNFEQGGANWTEYSSNGYTIISSAGSVAARSGSYRAWLGGADEETSFIQQQVTVPASCPVLGFYHYISSTDSCGWDFAYVRINGSPVVTYDLCSTNNTGGWVKRTVNLASYVGQTVTLELRATTDFSNISSWYIDDVAFQAN